MGLAVWSQSDAIAALARLVAVGIPIWFVLFLIFKQLRRVAAEQLETAELKQARAAADSDAIFELDDEALLLEQNRLRWMLRWILPGVSVALFLYLLIGHFVGWGWSLQEAFSSQQLHRTEEPMLMMWFIVAIGFVSFLYARYSIALAKMPHWRLLRAGATCMAGTAFACLLLAIALMAGTSFAWTEPLVAYLLRILLIVLGVEFAGNFLLDFYRPRTPGVLPRPSFESRMLGLVAEPGGIARSIADAINYQFGFEVSSTWFYQLLQRWLFPIMVFTVVIVLGLSVIVVVDADEEVVVERFGRVVEEPVAVLGPGMHFKWPYPIDVVHRAPVRRVREMVLGEATDDEHKHEGRAILWTEAHDYVPEMMLLVGAPRGEGSVQFGQPAARSERSRSTESVPAALLMVSVPIQYRVTDVRKYLYNYADPEAIVEAVAYQFLTEYGAGVDLDTLLGPGREELNRKLSTQLQQTLDAYDTGIEIVFSAVRGAHPPPSDGVAESFLRVITAETQKAATIHAAEGEAQRILTVVAGTDARAFELDQAIGQRDRLQSDPEADSAARKAAEQLVEDLLLGNPEKGIAPLSGSAAALIEEARAEASNVIADASTKVRSFKTDLVAFNSAPDLFRQRKWLEVWSGLDTVRKYLIVGDPSNVVIEYETAQRGGLDDVLSEEQ